MFLQRCRRGLAICAGSLLVVLGAILMPVPGPGGTPVFLAGLALLSTEFKWARALLNRFKEAYGSIEKKKRRALTLSLLVFYLAGGVIAWNWANRPDEKKMQGVISG